MRNNIAYLVRPSSQKQLYQKLYSACKSKKKRLRKVNKTEFKIDMGQEGIFKPVKAGQTVDQLQKKILSKNMKGQTDQEKQLFYAVENNLLFDMQMLLNAKGSLINSRDRKGNNLLHVAAKSRNQQFFQLLLKRTGPQGLQIKNNVDIQ